MQFNPPETNSTTNTKSSNVNKTALIMAGGTGGHVIPGLEIASALKEQGYKIAWLGTKWGLEAELVPNNNIVLYCLPIWGVRGKSLFYKLLAPFRIFISVIYSLYVLIKVKPAFVLGMGGFASGPGGIAAWILRIPLVIHEQNAIFGLTNKILKKISSKVLVSFPNLLENNHEYNIDQANSSVKIIDSVILTGNPVRNEIMVLADPNERWQKRVGSLKVLVIGGSRGALILNNTVPNAIAKLPVSQRPEIWHQSGKNNYEDTVNAYNKLGLKVKVEPFISDMASAYAWADLVIARAGALTVSELAAAGLPALLIPYPYATDDHQKLNASFLVDNNAALMVEQQDLTVDKLSEMLLELINSRPRLLEMALAARSLCMTEATSDIIKHCQEVAYNAAN